MNKLDTKKISLILLLLAGAILAFFMAIPKDASAEYIYTVEVIYKFCFWPFLLAGLVLNSALRRLFWRFLHARHSAPALLALAMAIFCVPIFSPLAATLPTVQKNMLSFCWVVGLLLLAFACFLFAARLANAFSGLLCLLASFILFFGLAEMYYFATDQWRDSYIVENENSKHVKSGQAQARLVLKKYDKWLWPEKPEHPSGAAAHREVYKNKPFFDVRYVFDDNNRRTMPPVSAKPGADILLFGCSFTFGYGLENEQTWAWRLSEDLGPDWRITNYAFSAFGAQEMLDMLEDNFVAKPTAPFREALFLAISGHLHRPTGLFDMHSSRYVLKDGVAARDGVVSDSPFFLLVSLPKALNGSQSVREITWRLNEYFQSKGHDHFIKIYLSLLEQSARILKEKYDTPLTVLVWPDLDEILPDLEKRGIRALALRKLLPEWNDPHGSNYHIVPMSEYHPNDLATREMAAGLAIYLRELKKEREQKGPAQ